MSKVKLLFVGYRTKLVAGVKPPDFAAPSNYKDQAKIAAYVADRQAEFAAEAKNMPYTGCLDEVFIIDPNGRDADTNRPAQRAVQYRDNTEEGKLPVAVRVRNYLIKHYKDAWPADPFERRPPQVAVVGFDPRTFLKILGLTCSLPSVGKPLPVQAWYANSDHRDIGEAVCPKEFRGLTLPFALAQRRPTDPDLAKEWDALLKDWPGPGVYPDRDAKIAVELAAQLKLT